MKLYKLIFLNSAIMGTLIAISSYSWFSMWMGLEINLLSIIPLFMTKNNIYSSESSMKYFITQAMASTIILMTVIMMLMTSEFINPLVNSYFSLMLNSALLTKLGAAPFHFWFPEMIEGLSWMNSLLLLTWQKIAPMMILMNNKINFTFMISIIVISLIISTTSGFNQISLRKIMAYSSINHIAWMLTAMTASFSLWLIYFIIYSIINLSIVSIFIETKTFYLNQINMIMNQDKLIKLTFMTSFLSLGGLPPFMGFLPKWLMINWTSFNNLYLLTFTLIITTLIMLFIYIRIMTNSMILSISEPKTLYLKKIKNPIIVTINMITLMSLIICTLTLNLT